MTVKTRIEINVKPEQKTVAYQIIGVEHVKDREADRPERSNNTILEMLLTKGIHAWQQEAEAPGLPPNRSKDQNTPARTGKTDKN